TDITTTEDELTEEEIAAIIAQLNVSELVGKAWDALLLKVPWLGPIFLALGITGPAGLILFIFIYIRKTKQRLGADAQLDADINTNTEELKGKDGKGGLKREIVDTKLEVAELAAVVKVLIPTVNFVAKGLNVLLNASMNDAVATQADGLTKEYQVVTGDLSKVLKSTTVGAMILQKMNDVKDRLKL
ncbi:MAG: hypothetical protein Q8N15_03490, partial [Bacillota bacterium]|nr:hypothetical protein [Bacillota bacterium]